MHQQPIPPRIVLALIAAALLLPIALCVLFGVASLLEAMGDTSGGVVLNRIALAFGILWAVDLICLVLAVAIRSMGGPDEPQ